MLDASRGENSPAATYLKDYQPPAWRLEKVDLVFELLESATRVTAELTCQRLAAADLELYGESLQLLELAVDGHTLTADQYEKSDGSLVIPGLPDHCQLRIVTEIDPSANTSLMGLYVSGGNFCTQCEAEGFRRMTYFPDRPDVLSVYSTKIIADKLKFPVLLSNGNLVETGEAEPARDGSQRHYALWHDPHPKPSYLFALVAGDLARIQDSFTTMSGKQVELNIYVQHHNQDQCEHAMRSLKNAMRWDEQVYGREYDLDVFNIVAVDDFNMGAMENKGLNVFNSKYVLARPDTATDSDYQGIEGVIGHEYFHNWSGNRVTCRDWFQLSLKEGFTVFRDQEFSADMSARGIKRIQDVNMLRTYQFREDAGPMAHPVRPDSYVEINNFYTLTVYEKGAEVVRMLYHLLGRDKFRAATDLYFERHDGQAVTTDDFVKAMEDASGIDLEQFRRWYSQAGTPELTVSENYDTDSSKYTLTVRQATPPTPGQAEKEPLHIPVDVGLVDDNGQALELQLEGESQPVGTSRVLHLRKEEERYSFININSKPHASLLRGFSAPVKLVMERSVDELCFLMAHDSDEFNRWDAAQSLATRLMTEQVTRSLAGHAVDVNQQYIEACRRLLTSEQAKPSLIAEALRLPAESYIADSMAQARPDVIHQVRESFRASLAHELSDELWQRYQALAQNGAYNIDPDAMGARALRNLCLGYLMAPAREKIHDRVFTACIDQYETAGNMTDVMAALTCLVNTDDAERDRALDQFYDKWKDETLVVDKWLALQASSRLANTFDNVKALTRHEAFNIKNPNKVRSLIGVFAGGNPYHFHRQDGAAYQFIADQIIQLDALNPQVAARLVGVFTRWRQFDEARQKMMREQLEKLARIEGLSKDAGEIISKSLA
jgi:aminopeptidase N